jgi:hypothetical protein
MPVNLRNLYTIVRIFARAMRRGAGSGYGFVPKRDRGWKDKVERVL